MSTAMHDTTLAVPGSADPTKRVNYVNGMILGVDDFIQEATYLLGRDRWLAREALGYGTLTGLDVTVDKDTGARWQVAVSPGVALTPTGYLVEVPRVQCATLDDWLIANRERVHPPAGGGPLSVYVVLRYDACLTDDQPVPGEPCGTQDVYSARSRITDDFALELSLDAPEQVEEDAVRAFAAWLAGVPVGAGAHSEEALAHFASLLRVFAAAEDPLPAEVELASPDRWGTVPPPAELTIPAGHVAEYLRVAFRVWATEFRPATWAEPHPLASTGPDEERLLLSELRVTLKEATDDAGNRVHITDPATAPVVDAGSRPVLAHLRLVQEWLLHQLRQGEGPATPPPAIELGDTVKEERAFGLAANRGTATALARADHTHGTPPDPIPAHRNDPNAHTLAGDVTGPVGKTKVEALQGRGVVATAPGEGSVLTFTGGAWRPAAPAATPASGPFVEHATDAPYRIVAAGTVQFSFVDKKFDIFPPGTYNGLGPIDLNADERTVTIGFEGYEPPKLEEALGPRYIVKATPWFQMRQELTGQPFVVGVRQFTLEGIELAVNPIAGDELPLGQIMIEISEYGAG